MIARHGNPIKRLSTRARWGVMALATAGALTLWQFVPTTSAGAPTPVDAAVDVPVGAPQSFADLIEAVQPAVVNIVTESTAVQATGRFQGQRPGFAPGSPFQEFFDRFFDELPRGESGEAPTVRGAGSGFIVSPDGTIVTNHHVVANAREITVTLDDGTSHEAELIGIDEKTDLAVIRIETDKDLPFVRFGDSEHMRAGDWVIAIGNPFGLGGTATTGIISARGRDLRSGPFDDFLQIDAPINQGNSGGPLFDLEGRVIGINTAIYSPNGGNIGIGFAIPSTLAEPVVASLRASGRVERGWLGVEIQGIDDAIAEGLGLEAAEGALVARVVPDSPAAKAGLDTGDVILSIDGEPVRTLRDLTRGVASTLPGESLELEIWREGEKRSLAVVAGDSAASRADASRPEGLSTKDPKSAKLGVRLAELDPDLRSRFQVSEDLDGVLILEVVPGSPAAKSGLRSGDVILMVGQSRVAGPETIREALADAADAGRETVVFQVARGDSRAFVAVPLA